MAAIACAKTDGVERGRSAHQADHLEQLAHLVLGNQLLRRSQRRPITALLRSSRRTATVIARTPLELRALDSDRFISVVLGYTPSAAAAAEASNTSLTASVTV